MNLNLEALVYVKQALEADKTISPDQKKDSSIAKTLKNIGLCLMGLQQYEEAFTYLKQSLEIRKISHLINRETAVFLRYIAALVLV